MKVGKLRGLLKKFLILAIEWNFDLNLELNFRLTKLNHYCRNTLTDLTRCFNSGYNFSKKTSIMIDKVKMER